MLSLDRNEWLAKGELALRLSSKPFQETRACFNRRYPGVGRGLGVGRGRKFNKSKQGNSDPCWSLPARSRVREASSKSRLDARYGMLSPSGADL